VVNLIEEGYDVALRALDAGLRDPGLVARRIAPAQLVLVASRNYLDRQPGVAGLSDPAGLAEFDTLGVLRGGRQQTWTLSSPDGETRRVDVQPRLLVSDFSLLHEVAVAGVGVALLPLSIAASALTRGELARIAPRWATAEQSIHLVYVSQRGMLPSVRALVDFLAARMPDSLSE